MTNDPSTTRRSLGRVLEGALYFFGVAIDVANVEQFEVLLDDAARRGRHGFHAHILKPNRRRKRVL